MASMSKTGAAAQPESQMIDTPSPSMPVANAGSSGGATAALANPDHEQDEWDLLDNCSVLAVLLRQNDKIPIDTHEEIREKKK